MQILGMEISNLVKIQLRMFTVDRAHINGKEEEGRKFQ